MAPYTITLGDESVWWCRIHTGNVCSPRCRQTRMQPSWCCKQNRDSSENMTLRSSWIQVVRLWTHYLRHSCLWCNVKDSRSHSRRVDSLCCWRIVRADIYLANHLTFWLRAHMAARFLRIRCLPSLLLVIAESWDLARHSVWPSWAHRFHILRIVKRSWPMQAAILRYDKSQPQQATIWLLIKVRYGSLTFSYTSYQNNFSSGKNVQTQFAYKKPDK